MVSRYGDLIGRGALAAPFFLRGKAGPELVAVRKCYNVVICYLATHLEEKVCEFSF